MATTRIKKTISAIAVAVVASFFAWQYLSEDRKFDRFSKSLFERTSPKLAEYQRAYFDYLMKSGVKLSGATSEYFGYWHKSSQYGDYEHQLVFWLPGQKDGSKSWLQFDVEITVMKNSPANPSLFEGRESGWSAGFRDPRFKMELVTHLPTGTITRKPIFLGPEEISTLRPVEMGEIIKGQVSNVDTW